MVTPALLPMPPLPFEPRMVRRLRPAAYHAKKAKLKAIKEAWARRLRALRAARAPWDQQAQVERLYTAARDRLERFIEHSVAVVYPDRAFRRKTQWAAAGIRYSAAKTHHRRGLRAGL